MKKRNRKIRSAMAAALAVSMVAAPCSSALAASTSDEITQREIDNAALAKERQPDRVWFCWKMKTIHFL